MINGLAIRRFKQNYPVNSVRVIKFKPITTTLIIEAVQK